MIDESDFIVFYVERNFGGAKTAMEYAKRKGKKFVNLYGIK